MYQLNYPLNLQIEITENCNHRCFYCYNSWQLSSSKSNMHPEIASELTDIIIKDVKPFHVTITGGEPLLNLESVKVIAEKLKQNKLFYNINTNLTLLDKERLDGLLKITANSKFGILTSLPHYERDKYREITGKDNLDIFYSNLENVIKSTKLPVTVNMVVHKLNFDSVYAEGKFLYEKFGIKNFGATPVIVPAVVDSKRGDYSLNSKEIAELLQVLLALRRDFGLNVDSMETLPRCLMPEELRNTELELFRRSCSAGRSTLSIDYLGGVRACSHSPFIVGNLIEDGFSKIWHKLEPFRNNEYVPSECVDCEEFFACNGGCRFFGYKSGSPLNLPDPRMTTKVTNAIKPIHNLPKVDEDKKYKVNSNFIYRQEADDIYAFFNGRFANVLFVNEQFKEFILTLQDIKRFKFNDLLKKLDTTDTNLKTQLEGMLRVLIDRRYVE